MYILFFGAYSDFTVRLWNYLLLIRRKKVILFKFISWETPFIGNNLKSEFSAIEISNNTIFHVFIDKIFIKFSPINYMYTIRDRVTFSP